jgi:multidrug efflux pump subunit AcrA (membrane-fusion protein)
MSAKVEIQIASLDNILGVPLQAVFSSNGESYVFVGNAVNYERRVVKIGMSSTDTIQILEGLQPGEVVLLSRPKDAPDDSSTNNRPDRQARKDPGSKGRA